LRIADVLQVLVRRRVVDVPEFLDRAAALFLVVVGFLDELVELRGFLIRL
jgi:hypothetical protein